MSEENTAKKVDLKDYVTELIANNDRRYEERFDSIEKIVKQGSQEAKEAVKSALDAQKEAVNAALTAAKEAVTKAEVASEKRFDSVNEFRSTLADQQRSLMPRAEAEIVFKSMSERLDKIENKIAGTEGKGEGIHQGWGWIAAVIGIVIAVVTLIDKFIK